MVTAVPNPAAYGHIASLLRKKLAERKWSMTDLAKAIGATTSGVSYWLTAKGAPSSEMRNKLVKLLEVNPGDLIKKDSAVITKPERPITVLSPASGKDVMVFRIADNGMARISLDITLPLDTATPIFRMLLDAGLVFNKDQFSG